MSEESPGNGPPRLTRRLRAEERALLADMVRGLPVEDAILHGIEDVLVEEMNDGGMGSLRVVRQFSGKPRIAREMREANFADIDGVSVSITVNIDQDGHLFELDIFKADYSPLRKFPVPEDVSIRRS